MLNLLQMPNTHIRLDEAHWYRDCDELCGGALAHSRKQQEQYLDMY